MTKSFTPRIFTILFTVLIWAFPVYSQDEIVTVRLTDVPLTEVLSSIESQTSYRFSYRNAIIDGSGKVSVNQSEVAVRAVLDKVLPPLGLDYKLESEKSISIFKSKKEPKTTTRKTQVAANGSAVDAFLDIPLPEAKVELLSAADSSKIMDVELIRIQDRNNNLLYAQYFLNLDSGKKYLLHGTHDGYEDAWIHIDVPDSAPAQIKVGDLRFQKVMRRSLDEVVVTATKIKMFWKGDTIVYDATAFKMPEGSMLDDLIRQMPGVSLNDDGEIFVNGRKVDELLLGSKSFFRGRSEVLLKNLPYYVVKNIKVYEKRSDLSEAIGRDVDDKKYVMDVNLKQEYNKGMIANVEAAGGTSSRYLGRAFFLGYADPYRFSIVGNSNNVNESRHIGQSDNWTPDKMPKSILTTHCIAAELSFDNKKIEETLTVDYSSASDKLDMQQRRETFVYGAKPLATSASNNVDKNQVVKLHNVLKFSKPWVYTTLDYGHRRFSSRFNSATEQYDGTLLTNSLSDIGFADGTAWDFKAHVNGGVAPIRRSSAYVTYNLEFTRSVEGSETMKKFGRYRRLMRPKLVF